MPARFLRASIGDKLSELCKQFQSEDMHTLRQTLTQIESELNGISVSSLIVAATVRCAGGRELGHSSNIL